MTGQGWVEHGLAAAMVATAAYCTARLFVPRLRGASGAHRDVDVVHAAMAVAMAAMLLGVGEPIWGGPVVLVFAGPAFWFAFRSLRVDPPGSRGAMIGRRDCAGAFGNVQLSVASVAMVYMSGVVPGFGSAAAASGTKILSNPHTHQHAAQGSEPVAMTTAFASVDFALAGAALFGLLAAFAVITLGQLAATADHSPARASARSWGRRLTLCCQLAMGVTMAHMLASMV